MYETCEKINMYIYSSMIFFYNCYKKSYKDVIVYIHPK